MWLWSWTWLKLTINVLRKKWKFALTWSSRSKLSDLWLAHHSYNSIFNNSIIIFQSRKALSMPSVTLLILSLVVWTRSVPLGSGISTLLGSWSSLPEEAISLAYAFRVEPCSTSGLLVMFHVLGWSYDPWASFSCHYAYYHVCCLPLWLLLPHVLFLTLCNHRQIISSLIVDNGVSL